MENILIDTDVILDFFFDRRPFSKSAARVLSLCETRRINGYITPVICSNAYYILRQTASHQKVIAKLSVLISVLDMLSMDKTVVLQALHSGFKDLEDALQYMAALQSGSIDLILTRNLRDYSRSDIAVLTPDQFLRLQSA
jgi:predicted nucleic acid-binding protein